LKYVRRILLVLAAAFVSWRIVSSGISGYYVDLLERGDADAATNALAWSSGQPAAMFRKALDLLEEDPAAADEILDKAYREDLADPRPLLALASIADARGENAQADALVEKAAQLRPADATVQRQVAGYWVSRGETELAMRHWSLALDIDPATRSRLFPLLLKIAEDPRARGLFKSIARDPPSWWESFFTTVASRALDLETVRVLYALRRGAGQAALSELERRVYIERLRKGGQITEAYLVWVNGLNEAAQGHLGLLHNGGFEVEPSNTGFGWHLNGTDKVLVNTATTYGIDGKKALHLIFKGREIASGNVFQRLFLDPGTYRVSGKVRSDSLETKDGIKWVVRCGYPGVEPLGESERFLGSGEWRDFTFEFQVQEECAAQEIRLDSGRSSATPTERKITGGVWFDGMSIRKLSGYADRSGE
jgi:tetratricopeptide (TPR) repeat protein